MHFEQKTVIVVVTVTLHVLFHMIVIEQYRRRTDYPATVCPHFTSPWDAFFGQPFRKVFGIRMNSKIVSRLYRCKSLQWISGSSS